jgi:hypothetical protein
MKRRKPRHAPKNETAEQVQSSREFSLMQRFGRFVGDQIFKKMELIFWLLFLCVPLYTGGLDVWGEIGSDTD